MRIIFMGSPAFSVPTLDALVAAGHEVVAVYCQPPRRAGRGKQERPTPVHARALALGLPVHCPKTLRDSAAQEVFAALKADVAIVIAYGLILPQAILDAPRLGCLNIHASLLPRWRGAAPIHRAIMAGDAETGVCIMQMEAGLDTGPVFARKALAIAPNATTGSVHDALAALGADLLTQVLPQLPMLATPQPTTGVTYAHKIEKSEAAIDWTRPAVEVDRQIRGLSPFPGAWTQVGAERVKLLTSTVAPGSGRPGEVIGRPLTVACGTGAVAVGQAQRAGRAAQSVDELQRGFAIALGQILGQAGGDRID